MRTGLVTPLRFGARHPHHCRSSIADRFGHPTCFIGDTAPLRDATGLMATVQPAYGDTSCHAPSLIPLSFQFRVSSEAKPRSSKNFM